MMTSANCEAAIRKLSPEVGEGMAAKAKSGSE